MQRKIFNQPTCLDDVYKGVAYKYTFRCSYGHIWKAKWNNVLNGTGCPNCSGNTNYVHNRTIEDIDSEILNYYNKTNKRPTSTTSKDFNSIDKWLNRNDYSSLSKRCDELKLPELRSSKRTIEDIDSEILNHYNKTNKRPTSTTSKDFNSIDKWLNERTSSLSKRCDELKLPELLNLNRTIEDIDKIIINYYNRNNERPTAWGNSLNGMEKEFSNINNWLRRKNSSLSKRCDELGLPILNNFNRTAEEVDEIILDFFKNNGKRPTALNLPAIDSYLVKKSLLSLSKRCDELGLPILNNTNRSIESIDKTILEQYNKTGKRPNVRMSKEFSNIGNWLRRKNSSLSKRCDELGLR